MKFCLKTFPFAKVYFSEQHCQHSNGSCLRQQCWRPSSKFDESSFGLNRENNQILNEECNFQNLPVRCWLKIFHVFFHLKSNVLKLCQVWTICLILRKYFGQNFSKSFSPRVLGVAVLAHVHFLPIGTWGANFWYRISITFFSEF